MNQSPFWDHWWYGIITKHSRVTQRTTFNGIWLLIEDELLWKANIDGRWRKMENHILWRTIFEERHPLMENALQYLWEVTFLFEFHNKHRQSRKKIIVKWQINCHKQQRYIWCSVRVMTVKGTSSSSAQKIIHSIDGAPTALSLLLLMQSFDEQWKWEDRYSMWGLFAH